MKLFNATLTLCSIALLGAMTAPSSSADAWNRKTVFTFSAPVEIPSVHMAGWSVLPAGTYVFKILDSQSDRHIVQILNKEETKVYATILAIPNYRLKVTSKPVMTFRERPAGQPEALRAWFYPGRNWGEEFVYPKAKAMEFAKGANAPVLFTSAELPAEVSEPGNTSEAPVLTELKRAPIMAVTPGGEEVQIAEVVTPPPAAETEAEAPQLRAQAEKAPLPATASGLGLLTLMGLLAIGGAMLTPSHSRSAR